MQRTVELLKYLPPYLQEYVEMYHLMTSENPEFQFVAANCKRTLNNTFIMYCDVDGIQRFENLLGIVAAEGDGLEFRQSRIMVKWNDCIPYTMKALLNKLIAMQGNNDIQVILNGYYITIITHMDNPGQSDSVWDLFNTMIPCNMDITHKNYVHCNTDGTFYVAAGTNYSRVTASEYTQWFGSQGAFYLAAGMNYGRVTVNEFTQHFNSSGTFKIGAGVSYARMTVNEFIQEFSAKGYINIGSGISYARMTVNDFVQNFTAEGDVYVGSRLSCGRVMINEYTQNFAASGNVFFAVGSSDVRMMTNEYTQNFTAKGNANLGVGLSNTEIIKII